MSNEVFIGRAMNSSRLFVRCIISYLLPPATLYHLTPSSCSPISLFLLTASDTAHTTPHHIYIYIHAYMDAHLPMRFNLDVIMPGTDLTIVLFPVFFTVSSCSYDSLSHSSLLSSSRISEFLPVLLIFCRMDSFILVFISNENTSSWIFDMQLKTIY